MAQSELLLAEQEDGHGGENHESTTDDGEHPGAIGTGLGKIKAAGIHHGERSQSVHRTLILVHIHIVAVHGSGGSQQIVLQMLLDVGVTTIVLGDAQGIVVAVTEGIGCLALDDNLNVVFQQGIAVIGLGLGEGVAVVLQTLDDDFAVARRNEVGGILLCLHMAGDVVHAIVQKLGFHKEQVAVVEQDELDVAEVALAVAELFGQVNTVHIHMAVIVEDIVVVGVGTFPGEGDFVGVAIVAVGNGIVGVDGGGVGDADGAVGVTGVHHVGAGVDQLVGVYLPQTLGSHGNGHRGVAVCVGGVVYGEFAYAVALLPGGDLVGAALIGEELQDHVVLVVGDALGDDVLEGVASQISGFGGDGRQRGDDLVFHHISGGGGSGVGIAVVDVSGGTPVMAGVGSGFTDGLLKAGDTGEVLGVQGHVIHPAGAAVGSVGAVHGGHRQRDKEGGGSGSDHFGDSGLHDEVQAQRKVGSGGMTVSVGLSHGGAAIGGDIGFQRVLHSGGIGSQCFGQGVH